MDLSKYPLERLFFFVAAVIPGFVVLLIYQLAVPGSFGWFFAMGFLGYKTKLTVILVTAFIIGNCMTSFVSSLAGAAGGAVGAYITRRPLEPSDRESVAPWRDTAWRSLARSRLGVHAPDDTRPIAQAIYDQRVDMAKHMPADQQSTALMELTLERGKAAIDDMRWESWYDHYHRIILNPENLSVEWYVQNGFVVSMQTTAIYVLISATIVPGLRHWWCILPSVMWVLIAVSQIYAEHQKYTNKWSTLSDQIKYLSREEPI